MLFATYFGIQERGLIVYHLVVIVGCHMYAILSWHLIERPAMALKNWSPQWFSRAGEWVRPWRDRITELVQRHAVSTPKAAR
jgi:hypothetical protein